MYSRTLQSVVLLFALILFTGCGESYTSVSGQVTIEGKPVALIQVVFSPEGPEITDISQISEAAPPFSLGVTDEQGRYTLKTRYGDMGAVPSVHTVRIGWSDVDLDQLRLMRQFVSDGHGAPEKIAKAQSYVDEMDRRLASRPKLKENLKTSFTVVKGSPAEANFEISDL